MLQAIQPIIISNTSGVLYQVVWQDLFSLQFYQGKIKLLPIRMLNKQKRKQSKLVYLIATTSMNLCINLKTVQTIPVHCEEKPKFYNVHQNVFKLMRGPISSITQDKPNISLVKKFWFLLSHIEKNTTILCLANASIHHNPLPADHFKIKNKNHNLKRSILFSA